MNNDMGSWLDGFFELNPDAIRDEVETKAKKKESTLTLAMELPAMDFRDKDFYKNLSEEHKKEISLWILMRYMSSSQGAPEQHLTIVNDVVNTNFSSLSRHPELQWKLLALCGTGKKQFHPWIPPGKKAKKNKLEEALINFFPLMKDSDLAMLQQINKKEDLEQFFRDNAFDDKTIKEIFKGDTKGK
jgi:hypothetical protein